jgi:hypothetical protein
MRVTRMLLAVLVFLAAGIPNRHLEGAATSAPQGTSAGEYDNLEAVLNTSNGEIVIELFPKDAPRHVESFVKNARDGAYDGTTFHRLVKYALIQGGDPLSKNPKIERVMEQADSTPESPMR